jgi:hypothetical protein
MAIIEKEVKPSALRASARRLVGSKGEHKLVGLFDSGNTYYQGVGASGTSRLTAYLWG